MVSDPEKVGDLITFFLDREISAIGRVSKGQIWNQHRAI